MKLVIISWYLTILAVSFWTVSPLAAAPKSGDEDDVPVAEGPVEESARPEEKSPPTVDDDELLKALEARKAAAEESDRLERAIEGMRTAQKRISGADTSPETQQIQGQVVKDLEELLALLKKQQQSGQGSGQQNPNQRNSKNQRQQSQKGRGAPQDADSQSRRGDEKSNDSEERSDPARARAADDARRAAMIKDVWGHLPPHLRQAIRNALRDNYLPKYDDLVKKYYEALAEKNRKRSGK